MEYVLHAGDTAALRVRLLRADGTPIVLGQPPVQATVLFQMVGAVSGLPPISEPAVVLEGEDDPDNEGEVFGSGLVEYRWGTGETDTPGMYRASFKVTMASGEIETVPNADELTIRILA